MNVRVSLLLVLLVGCGNVDTDSSAVANDAGGIPDSTADVGTDDADGSVVDAPVDAFAVCNAPSPEEACEIPACREILVQDCWIAQQPHTGQTVCACLLGREFQHCAATAECPAGQHCVSFSTLYCHPQYGKPDPWCSLGTTNDTGVCWPE